jgi:hypothetical protein
MKIRAISSCQVQAAEETQYSVSRNCHCWLKRGYIAEFHNIAENTNDNSSGGPVAGSGYCGSIN